MEVDLMGTLSNKHLGASAYQNPAFDDQAVSASIFQRVWVWLTMPLLSFSFEDSVADEGDGFPALRIQIELDQGTDEMLNIVPGPMNPAHR